MSELTFHTSISSLLVGLHDFVVVAVEDERRTDWVPVERGAVLSDVFQRSIANKAVFHGMSPFLF